MFYVYGCFTYTYIYVLHVCGVCWDHISSLNPLELELQLVIPICKPFCGCWELDPGPPQKQWVLFMAATFL